MIANRGVRSWKTWAYISILICIVIATGCDSMRIGGIGEDQQGEVLEEHVFEGWTAALDGDRLVYFGDQALNVVDLARNTQLATIKLPADLLGFDLYGDYVVWSDLRHEKRNIGDLGSMDLTNADIFLYDLKNGKERQLTEDASAQVRPKIWGHYVVWMDNSQDAVEEYPSDWQIMLYDLNTGVTKAITNTPGANTDPDIQDGKVVWEDGRNVVDKLKRAGENLPENNTDIYLYDIVSGETLAIAEEPYKEAKPHISGNRIVWNAYGRGSYNANVYVYDLTMKQKKQLTDRKEDQSMAVISGNYVAWMDERRGGSSADVIENGKKPNSDIYLLDLALNSEVRMTGDEPQILPLLSDNWLVYVTARDVNPELHAVRYR